MITVDNINKSFNGKKIINDLSFHIPEGEVVGFIGANGAGKSTTIKMLTGTLMSDSGLIFVAGVNPFKNKKMNLKNIGVVSSIYSSLWQEMKLIDSFDFSKHMYKLTNAQFEESKKYICEKLELNELLNIPVTALSLGQRMRAEIGFSLIHNPKVLYLDEATIGLDVENREKVLSFIKEINKEKNTTILFTSNILKDIEKICERIIIIDKGIKVYEGKLDKLKKKYASEYVIEIKSNELLLVDFQDLPINKYEIKNNMMKIFYRNDIVNSSTIIKHVLKKCFIKDINIIEPTLEDIIRKIYEG